MPSIFIQSKVIVEKTAALRVIESLPRPMRPKFDDLRSSDLYKFLHKLLKNIDRFPQEYVEMYNGLTLKTAQGFWLEMFGYSVGLMPKTSDSVDVDYTSDQTTEVLVDEVVRVVIGHSAGGIEERLYKKITANLPSTDLSTIDFTNADWEDVTPFNEDASTFKSRIINEIFKSKISNVAIAAALQPFSSTEVFVLDKLGAHFSGSEEAEEVTPSELPFLSVDKQEFYTKLTADINSTDTTIYVADTSYFANTGGLRIGNEVMTYDSKTINSFHITKRGKGDTIAAQHFIDDHVLYSSRYFNLFLDAFNILAGYKLDPETEGLVVEGAFEFDVFITPFPAVQNTYDEISAIIEKFKAAGTKAYINIGLPFGS